MANITLATLRGYWQNVSDWVKGVDSVSSPKITVSASLPAGDNNIGNVDVLTLPTFPTGTNLMGKVGIDQTTDGTTNRTVSKISQTSGENVVVLNCLATTNGGTNYKLNSAATTNATSLKASAGRIHSLVLTNTSAAIKYFKLYNKATAPTVGTDVPVMVIGVPTLSTVVPVVSDIGMFFSTGIAFATTGLSTDADTTAVAVNDLLINAIYA